MAWRFVGNAMIKEGVEMAKSRGTIRVEPTVSSIKRKSRMCAQTGCNRLTLKKFCQLHKPNKHKGKQCQQHHQDHAQDHGLGGGKDRFGK